MKVRIKRIDESLPLPVYETNGAVGFDMLCREDSVVGPHSLARLPSNLVVKVPEGYALFVTLRSSTPKKKSLLIPHGIGVIDNDFCGKDDEVLIQVYNFSDNEVVISKGEKIAQGIFVKIDRVEWEEAEMEGETRGGFGSTG